MHPEGIACWQAHVSFAFDTITIFLRHAVPFLYVEHPQGVVLTSFRLGSTCDKRASMISTDTCSHRPNAHKTMASLLKDW